MKDERRSLFKTFKMACMGCAVLSLTACETMRDEQNRLAAGAIVGALAGGFLGYYSLGSGSGRWIGAAIGSGIGAAGGYLGMDYYNRMSKRDRAAMHTQVFEGLNEVEAGAPIPWHNQESGNGGQLTPTRTYLDRKGKICREFDSEATLEGVKYEGRGLVCRNEAGTWIMV